jgi:hypothetical protein
MNELDRRAWGDSRHERSIGLTKGRAATGRDVHIVSKIEDDLGISFVCLFVVVADQRGETDVVWAMWGAERYVHA